MSNNLQEIQNMDGIFNVEKIKILKEIEPLSRGFIVKSIDKIEIVERK